MNDKLLERITELETKVAELQSSSGGNSILSPLFDLIGLDPTAGWIAVVTIMVLAYVQNISFSIVSRSRNRDNMRYHIIASIFSNCIWFLTFRELVIADMTFYLLIPYTIATVAGSVTGAKVSMWIEGLLGASADGHLKK